MVRLQRDLREAEKRAEQVEQAQVVTAEAFEESQRALAEAEMAVADLRAELDRAEQSRDQVKRGSERSQAAEAKAVVEVERAGQRVKDLLARIETL
jgi:chromosome segregation ATPase